MFESDHFKNKITFVFFAFQVILSIFLTRLPDRTYTILRSLIQECLIYVRSARGLITLRFPISTLKKNKLVEKLVKRLKIFSSTLK